MQSESEIGRIPAIPSVGRLGWLLVMQPAALRSMYQTWEVEDKASLISLWYRRNPDGQALIRRHAALLLVVMPLSAVLAAAALSFAGISVQMYGVAIGVIAGIVGGVAGSVAGGLTFGVVFALLFGLSPEIAYAAIAGLTLGTIIGGLFSATVGVPFGVVFGVLFSLVAIADNLTLTTETAILGILLGMMSAIVLRAFGAKRMSNGAFICLPPCALLCYLIIGPAAFFGFTISAGSILIGLAYWGCDFLVTQMLVWRMHRNPEAVGRLASWLSFRNDEILYPPLPGLRACLIAVSEVDSSLGKELIAQAAALTAQRHGARLALIELQARDLENAARGRFFSRAAGLDFPFLPTAQRRPNIPFTAFQAAARDLIAGSSNQRQRRLALERARTLLEVFRTTTIGSRRPSLLARRLLTTATLWLDVIRDEEVKLTREVADHPEVPTAFIAGPPLSPDRVEERSLFKGRREIIDVIAHDLAPDRRGLLHVVGQRRMGKTSLCNYLATYLGTGTTIVVSNFQPLSGDKYRETPHWRVLDDMAARCTDAPPPPSLGRWREGLHWLEEIDRSCSGRKILIVIDELERVEDGIRDRWCSTDFLDFLRAAGDALQHIRFLLLTAYPLHRLGPHWTDRLVSVTSRTISYLSEHDARELLVRPIPEFPDIYPEGGVDRILEQTGRHPYLLQKAGDDLCRLLNSRGGLRKATDDELTEVFDGMIRDVQVFDEIWRSRTEDERSALRRIARSDEPGQLDAAAIQLVREDYLWRQKENATIAVPLFREWIRMNVV